MTRAEQATALAAQGFYVFPLKSGSKLPALKDWPTLATRDPEQIAKWFARDRNIGIATGRFGDSHALVVVDVDVKNGKDGNASLLHLELAGQDLPATFEQCTPSGGRHLVYVCDTALRQGVDTLGSGLDIRSDGGFIVGPGSQLDGKEYVVTRAVPAAPAPAWLTARLGSVRPRVADRSPVSGVDPVRAAARAVEYLKTAPVSIEGEGGDVTAFKVAAELKDLGLTETNAFAALLEDWNQRCEPPWPYEDLEEIVGNAFKYGKDKPGIAAPEAVFNAVPLPIASDEPKAHPFDQLNREYAFVKTGAFVLQETTDADGRFVTQHLNMAEFHGWHANVPFSPSGGRQRPISECWVEWTGRRQYEAVVFAPGLEPGMRWYNLWRGFSVAPAATGDHPSVTAFIEHAFLNVCDGDPALLRWLMGYFAHMIQRPGEKPLVALVFKGAKGVGKNALVERIGALLGNHFMVADDERYLLSNFNSHLESCLFLALDEAAWAGDKRAEGKLKGLITGANHNIERKGKEAYKVKNLTRVAIIGNERWLVPASVDERRFAVFNVGEGRKQDRQFFIAMREGMEAGGYANLLRYLLDYDLTGIDVNAAPNTKGLVEQKLASMEPQEEWWFDCLCAGEIAGGDFGGEWPARVSPARLREAFRRWASGRGIKSRLPQDNVFGRTMKKIASSYEHKKVATGGYAHVMSSIEQLRSDWEAHLGGKVEWPTP